jgi:hypothetical protein
MARDTFSNQTPDLFSAARLAANASEVVPGRPSRRTVFPRICLRRCGIWRTETLRCCFGPLFTYPHKYGLLFKLDRRANVFSIPVLGTEPSGHDVIKARNEHEQARERVRLWYVAATRARDLLVLPRHSAKLMRAKIDPDREPIRPGPSCRMFHNTPAPDRTILVQTDYGRVERMNRDRPISAIGADAKELPRQRGGLGGAITGRTGAIWGMGPAGVQ